MSTSKQDRRFKQGKSRRRRGKRRDTNVSKKKDFNRDKGPEENREEKDAEEIG